MKAVRDIELSTLACCAELVDVLSVDENETSGDTVDAATTEGGVVTDNSGFGSSLTLDRPVGFVGLLLYQPTNSKTCERRNHITRKMTRK